MRRSPWSEDGIVQEVLKHLPVGGVSRLGLQVLRRLWTGATGAFVRLVWFRLGRLGLLLLVANPRGGKPDGDLQLWKRARRKSARGRRGAEGGGETREADEGMGGQEEKEKRGGEGEGKEERRGRGRSGRMRKRRSRKERRTMEEEEEEEQE